MHVSKCVCKTGLKELAINTGKPLKKILQPLTFLKILLLSFRHILKYKYLLEHLTIVISGNVTKYVVLDQYEQYIYIHMVYWHLLVVSVKFSLRFNSYINSQTSAEITADKK